MEWAGINRKVTDIGAPSGMAYYMANARLRQSGEAQRRYGFGKSSVDKASAGIVGMAVTYTANGPIYMNVTSDGTVNGQPNPNPPWVDVPWVPPAGVPAGPSVCDRVFAGGGSGAYAYGFSIADFTSGIPAVPCAKDITISVDVDTENPWYIELNGFTVFDPPVRVIGHPGMGSPAYNVTGPFIGSKVFTAVATIADWQAAGAAGFFTGSAGAYYYGWTTEPWGISVSVSVV